MAREPVTHTLKMWPEYFDASARGEKLFEVRKDDRDYQSGDKVELHRFLPNEPYGGYYDTATAPLHFRIGFVLRGGQFGIEPGTCVFSLQPMEVHAHADR